jgi:hypothetical protein
MNQWNLTKVIHKFTSMLRPSQTPLDIDFCMISQMNHLIVLGGEKHSTSYWKNLAYKVKIHSISISWQLSVSLCL